MTSPSIKNRQGFTLLEVLVAMSISAMVVALAFGSWAAISRHTNRLERARLLDTEARRIAVGIGNEARRSPCVLVAGPDQIRLVSAITFDTVAYSTDGSQILRNDVPVVIRSPHSRVTAFSVENLSALRLGVGECRLLKITLSLEDDFQNRASVPVLCAAQVADVRSFIVE